MSTELIAPKLDLSRVEHISITDKDGRAVRYVAASAYEAAVDDRDDFRRHLTLINAWRLHYAHLIDEPAASELGRLLSEAGETVEIGQAVRGIAASLGVINPRWAINVTVGNSSGEVLAR